MVNGLLKDIMSQRHIKLCLKTMRMHHDGSASNSKTQILQTNIQIRCPLNAPSHLMFHLASCDDTC